MQHSGCCSLIASLAAIKALGLGLEWEWDQTEPFALRHMGITTKWGVDGAKRPPELVAQVGRSTGDNQVTFSAQEQGWGKSFGRGGILWEERDILNDR